jgi:hypothetical protein
LNEHLTADKELTMNRATAFITGIASALLLIPVLLKTEGSLTLSLVITAALLLAVLVADRRVNRRVSPALQYCPIHSPSQGS